MTTPLVIKLSGKALVDENKLLDFFSSLHDTTTIFVHGGGIEVDNILKAMHFNIQKIDGLRVSTKDQMPFITAALAGLCNKKLQAMLQKAHIKAQGLLCTDFDMTKLSLLDSKYGYVGTSEPFNKSFIEFLLDKNITPVIASIGIDDNGNLINVNADDVAKSIATLLSCPLIFLSDVQGVLDENNTVIESIDTNSFAILKANGTIKDGMAVKVQEALDASLKTNAPVFITSLDNPSLKDIKALRRLGSKIQG